MNRRSFLFTSTAAAIAPALPAPPPAQRFIGVDLAEGPDVTTIAQLDPEIGWRTIVTVTGCYMLGKSGLYHFDGQGTRRV